MLILKNLNRFTISYACLSHRIDGEIIATIQRIKEEKRLEELAAAEKITEESSPTEEATEATEATLFPFNASIKRPTSVADKSNKSSININEKDADQVSMVKVVRRWSNNKPLPNKIGHAINSTNNNNNGDSGFNESTDTNIVLTPPNGKINFNGEKSSVNLRKNTNNRNQVMPEVMNIK